MTDPVFDIQSSRDTASRYSRVVDNAPNLTSRPSLVHSIVQANLSDTDIRGISGFVDTLDATMANQLAAAGGARINYSNSERAYLGTQGVDLSSTDASAITRGGVPYIDPTTVVSPKPEGEKADEDLSWLEKTLNFGGTVLGNTGKALISNPIVTPILNTFTALYKTSTMPFRVASSGLDKDNNDEVKDSMLRNGYDPNSLWDQIQFYYNGDVYHDLDGVEAEYGRDEVDLGLRIMEAPGGVEGYLSSLSSLTPDKIIEIQERTATRDFKQMMDVLADKRTSIGRDTARLFVDEGSDPFNYISGTIDGIVMWFTDPTLLGFKAAKMVQVSRRGLENAADVNRIREIMATDNATRSGWQSFLDDAAEHRTLTASGDEAGAAGVFAAMNSKHKKLMPMFDEINGRRVTDIMANAPRRGAAVRAESGVLFGAERSKPIRTIDEATAYLTSTNALLRFANGMPAEKNMLMPGKVSKWAEAKALTAQRRTARGLRGGAWIDHTDPARNLPTQWDELAPPGGTGGSTGPLSEAQLRGESIYKYARSSRGRFNTKAKRLSTLLPEGRSFGYADAQAPEMVRRYAAIFMPKAESNLIASRFAAGTEAERRAIYDGMVEQSFHSAGLAHSEFGRKFIDEFRSKRSLESNRRYGFGDNDLVNDAALGQRRVALYPAQLEDDFILPNFKEMLYLGSKASTMGRFHRGIFQSQKTDDFMTAVKLGWLVRPATGLRSGLEELSSGAVSGRFGAMARVRGVMSVNHLKLGAQGERVFLPRIAPQFRDRSSNLAGALTGSVLSKMSMVSGEARHLGTDADILKYVDELSREEAKVAASYVEFFGRSNMHVNDGAIGFDQVADDAARQGVPVQRFKMTGYTEKEIGDGGKGAEDWANNLRHRFDGSGLGEVALRGLVAGTPRDVLVAQVDDVLGSPAMREFTERAELSQRLPNGNRALTVEQKSEARRRHAERIVDDIDLATRGRNGRFDDGLVTSLLAGRVMDRNTLNKIAMDARPEHAIGRLYAEVPPGSIAGRGLEGYTHAVSKAYDLFNTRVVAWMSRQPMMTTAYVTARQNLAPYEANLVKAGLSAERAESMAIQQASFHAAQYITRRIDNPLVRSQFAMTARNHWMFVRATEDFGRRWYRLIKESPEIIRKAQMAIEGGIHSGFLDKDENGELIFSYPGSGYTMEAVAKAGALLGMDNLAKIPVNGDLTSRLTFLNASLDNPLGYSASPIISTPIKLLSAIMPESAAVSMAATDRIVNGELGAGRKWYEAFMPAPVLQLWKLADDDGAQVASAQRNALIQLDAAGLMPSPDASPSEKQEFIDRVRTQVQNQMFTRALFSFVAPAAPSSPENDFGDDTDPDGLYQMAGLTSLKDEFRVMVDDYGYETAMAVWAKLHPDEFAYTQGATEVSSDAFAPLTLNAANWMGDNAGTLKMYSEAATYFIPSDPGEYSQVAYNAQLRLGVRQVKELDYMYDQLANRASGNIYYEAKKVADADIALAKASGNADYAKELEAYWSDWKETFYNANPLFYVQQSDFGTRTAKREQTLGELRGLVADESSRGFQGIAEAADMLAAYDTHVASQLPYEGRRDTEARVYKAQELLAYNNYLRAIVEREPALLDLYNAIFATID